MIKVNPGELPAIGAAVGAQNSSLAAFLQSVAPYAVPLPSVACAPGLYMTAGFAIVDAVLSSYIATGLVESSTAGASLGPISVTFAATDTAGSAGVSAVGGAVGASVLGG
jgi:hypothetical protein